MSALSSPESGAPDCQYRFLIGWASKLKLDRWKKLVGTPSPITMQCTLYCKLCQTSLACFAVGANTGSLNGCHPAPLCTFTHSACASSMYSTTAKLLHIELREVSGVHQRLPRCNKTCPNHLDRIYLLTNTSQVIGCSITRSTVRNYA